MEEWLKENDFEEQDGQWWFFGSSYKVIVFLEESNSWTAYLSESIYGWNDKKNLLFFDLNEDQAKIIIDRITRL